MLVLILGGAAAVGPAQPDPPSATQGETGLFGRARAELDELAVRAGRALERLKADGRAVHRPRGIALLAPDLSPGPAWIPIDQAAEAPPSLVLLIHGLDEPGPIWDDLGPALRSAGFRAARFDYPNDQPIAASADLLGAALRDLRSRGVTRVDLVCHSMGGLVARDVLTRPTFYAGRTDGHADLPDVRRFIAVGTPNAGSPWAKLRAVAEIREQVERFLEDPRHDWRGLLGYLSDGLGEAGDDLLPGSAYLTALNSRPLPEGVAITLIAGRLAPVKDDDLTWLTGSWLLRRVIGPEDAAKVAAGVAELSTELGDGVVPVASTLLPGVEDVVYLDGFNHRSMLKASALINGARKAIGEPVGPPAAIPVILDRLVRPAPGR
jgi:pimeloyl-ACP methyl ester carboxylesterase